MTFRRSLLLPLLAYFLSLGNLVTISSFSGLGAPRQQSAVKIFQTSKEHGVAGDATASALASSPLLSPLESWCVTHIHVWYSQSLSIKCPFLKRRTADLLDGLDMIMRFLIIRHKSLDLIGPPPGCRSSSTSQPKLLHTTMDERLELIRRDWKPESNKGYYITGRLNSAIYRDDCLFDGPDPDMPVKGLRKYVNAVTNLFHTPSSTAELLSMDAVASKDGESVVVARWRLQGVLQLPWHPSLPQWTGSTTYHFDKDGLIYHHEEEWDISVAQAFLETLWPQLAYKIWKREQALP